MPQGFHDRYGYADPAGKHLLDTYPNAYGAHGFVYVEWYGSIIATGGDGAITVGIYDSEDALNDGHASSFREWDIITPQTIAEAVAMIEHYTDTHPGEPDDDVECECEIPFTGMLAECTACHPPHECDHNADWHHHYDPDSTLGDYYTCTECGELTQVG